MLKILTYNIHKGFSVGNRRYILHKIKSALHTINADIIFLQEVHGQHTTHSKNIQHWPENSQFEYLADELWTHHAYGKNAIYTEGHHGNVILSKLPFKSYENINVSYLKSASRSLLHGVLKCPGSNMPLHVICVHFGLFSYERKQQIFKLIERIKEHIPEDEPLIIAGDFNDWQGRAEKYLSHELGLKEIFRSAQGKHARTFPAWLPLLSMDRIYTRNLKILDYQRLHHKNWRGLSDHLPLTAEIEL
jgi:endonuclease/exonuclease/phosphatase family metal-dependent hydrolase